MRKLSSLPESTLQKSGPPRDWRGIPFCLRCGLRVQNYRRILPREDINPPLNPPVITTIECHGGRWVFADEYLTSVRGADNTACFAYPAVRVALFGETEYMPSLVPEAPEFKAFFDLARAMYSATAHPDEPREPTSD